MCLSDNSLCFLTPLHNITENPFYYAITAPDDPDRDPEPFYFNSERPDLRQGVILDCLPFLRRYPGGSIQWYVNTRDQDQILAGYVLATSADQNITGDFNHLLNIESTKLADAAESGTSGLYTCEVCIGRGSSRESCSNGTADVFVLGEFTFPHY